MEVDAGRINNLRKEELDKLKEFLNFMQDMNLHKVKVLKLASNFREILYKLGYSDTDVITRGEVSKILKKRAYSDNLGTQKIPRLQKVEFTKEGISTVPNTMEPNGTLEFQMEPNGIDFENFTKVLKRIIPDLRPSSMIPLYVLYHKGKLSRSTLLQLSKKFARSIGLSESSAKRALSEISKDHLLVNKHIIDGEEFLELSSSLLNDIKLYLKEMQVNEQEELEKKADEEKIIEEFSDFLVNFKDNKKAVYLEVLKDVLTVKGSKAVVIDWQDLASYNPTLAEAVLDTPDDVIPWCEEAVSQVLKEELLVDEPPHLYVRFTNLPVTLKVKDVGSDHINKLIQVVGVVSRQTEHKPFAERAVFVCMDCGNEMVRLQKPYMPILRPGRCDACGSRHVDLDVSKSKFKDAQWFRIQDLPEGAQGLVNRFIKAIVLDDLVDTFLPGDKVRVVGILRVRMFRKNGIPLMDKILEVNNIEVLTKRIQDVELDEARIEEIKKVAKKKDVVNLIVRSIAPSIYGYEDVKKGIALALFSGGDVVAPDGTVTRGASHVLLVGDPGTAKSTISRFLQQVIPRGVWTTAKTSSAAGLTATAVQDKDSGTWTLEAGALVLANGGICVIDEFDKMSDKDRAAIHEALEQGTISVSKAGINVILPAKTTVIAIGNPKYGRFDPNRDEPLLSQINLPPTLLSRFDLIFPIIDVPDTGKDSEIAAHILSYKVGIEERSTPVVEHLPVDLLKDYIAYARNNVEPVLTKEAADFLRNYYVKVRSLALKEDGTVRTIPITARQLEGLWRLARARARMRLSERIELEDVKDVIELFESNMRALITDEEGNLDVTILEVGKSTREIDKEATALSIIRKLETDEGAPYEDVIEALSQKLEIPRTEARKLIDRLVREDKIYMPRVGFLRISQFET